MATTFFFRREKKLRARAYVSDSNSTRDSVVFVVRADKSEEVHRVKSVLIVGEIDRGDEVGVEVWYPVGTTAVLSHSFLHVLCIFNEISVCFLEIGEESDVVMRATRSVRSILSVCK